MSQFRQDNITKTWVLIAPKRAKRFEHLKEEKKQEHEDLPVVDPSCVFCPGNEHLNPETLFAIPNEKKWQVRVMPNKYEAMSHETLKPLNRANSDFYISRPGVGDHEVIILREHNKPVALYEEDKIRMAIDAWAARLLDLQDHVEVRYVHIMQNHGSHSGASIAHPHFQIFAVPFIPNHVQDELKGAAGYFMQHEKCVYCDMIEREIESGSRMVLEEKDYVVFALFASRVPFQLRLIPRKHSPSFGQISASEKQGLAKTLKKTLKILYDKLGNPDYNFYIHTIPNCTPKPAYCDPSSYHWHLEILPRTNTWAGFELGTEIYVNSVPPEDAASFLRGETDGK